MDIKTPEQIAEEALDGCSPRPHLIDMQGIVEGAIRADRAQRPNPLKVLEDAIQEARDEFEEVQYHYAWYSPEYTTVGDRLKALEDVYDMLKAGETR